MIIDVMSGSIPTQEGFAGPEAALARLRGYREHFGDGARVHSRGEMLQSMEETFEEAKLRAPDEEAFIAQLDDAGIDKAVIYTEDYSTRLGHVNTSNDEVAEWVAKHPDRFIGVGGIDPWQDNAAHEVDRAVKELGLEGVLLSPFKQGLAPGSARLGRVFARCEALGLPVLVHCGVNWFAEAAYDVGHPRGIDEIALSFPNLKIVAVHAAWPWVMDMMVVAWRHPNVYVDFSAHRPKHFTIPDSGWGPLLHYGSRMLQDRIMFGSTWTLLRTSPKVILDEARALPVPDDVMVKWLGGNAARLFELN